MCIKPEMVIVVVLLEGGWGGVEEDGSASDPSGLAGLTNET